MERNTVNRSFIHGAQGADPRTVSRGTAACEERVSPFLLNHWLVKPDCNELHDPRTGELRSLEPRLMRLLCVLATAPNQVFDREQLMAHLWPKVIVNENSLTRAVSELRRKLACDGEDRVIDTIPKKGYRLSAECSVRESQGYEADPVSAVPGSSGAGIPPSLSATLIAAMRRFLSRSLQWPGVASGATLALGAVFVVLMQVQSPHTDARSETTPALADINLSSQAEFDALMAGKLATVAAQRNIEESAGATNLDRLSGTQPVVSRDGELFAFIRYNDEGSSLVLGSTQLPSSPVTVFTTEDTIYNLQWSPVDRALLFAQTPKFSPAAMLPMNSQASLVLFDLESFTTRVVYGPAAEVEDDEASESRRSFKLTSLTRSLDWFS